MSSPAAFNLENSTAYCLSKKPQKILNFWNDTIPNIKLICFSDPGLKDIPRYMAIAEIFSKLSKEATAVAIEGYAFGAKGRVFQIGENTGILISKILNYQSKIERPSPAQIKKFATDKGNADKAQMLEAFCNAIGCKLLPLTSPYTDIADAYWTAKWLKSQTESL
jgi:Holliday junction resolvasome RuvABC endonuclease subunit